MVSLCEEYAKRKSIDIPLIPYNKNVNVFVKRDTRPISWRVISAKWREGSAHPGYYELTYAEPIHDGYKKPSFLTYFFPPDDPCYFDQYEPQMLDLIAGLRLEGYRAVPVEEQVLAAWSFFLIIYDSWLGLNMDEEFFWLVSHSLQSDLPLEARLEACNVAQKKLSLDGNVAEFWHFRLRNLAECPSETLVKIINE